MREQLLAITSSNSFQLELWRDFSSFTANSSPNPKNSISFATVKHQEKKGRNSEGEKENHCFQHRIKTQMALKSQQCNFTRRMKLYQA